MNITLANVQPTTTTHDRDGIDADVVINGTAAGSVTLLRDRNDELTTWGAIDMWASWELCERLDAMDEDEKRETIRAIVGAANA